MNGTFFIVDTTTQNLTSMTGKYLSPLNGWWVISKEPERRSGATSGSFNEWQSLYDIQTENWIFIPSKNPAIGTASIVDDNVIGPFVDYVVQYQSGNRSYYYRDRNVDGIFSTADYSVRSSDNFANSILGPYNSGQSYIKQFNNSVMLYPNLRMVINGNAVVSYSYTINSSRIGTILIPFGDLQEDYFPNMYFHNDKQYIISKNAIGYIRIIRLGTNVPNRIERMAQYIHRINTVDTVNILAEREERITAEYGSLDWNNKFELVNNVLFTPQSNTIYHVNSGYNPLFEMTGLRSASMMVSDTTFTLYGTLHDQLTSSQEGFTLNFINCQLPDGQIDVFYDPVQPSKYRYSIINNTQRFFTDFEGQHFPLGPIVPFPIGTNWSLHNELLAVGEMGLSLLAVGMVFNNKTLDLYPFSNQIYFGSDSFNLFGIQYVFDGDYIYQDSDRIAMAFEYKFMGCDNNAAYFYNSWDKSIYLFTGSRTLNKSINLTNRSLVKLGRHDGFSGEMIFLTEDEILKSREGSIMNFPYKPENNIIPTKVGPYIKLEDGSHILLSPKDGNVDVFEIITGFIGIDGSTVCDFERIDVRLFSPEKTPLEFKVEAQTINQDTKESEQKQISLKANDWSTDGYKTLKLIPQYKKGTGLSLRIYSEQEINIAEIEFTYNPVSRTANSQRSGY